MAAEWKEIPFSEAVLLNPTTPLKRGSVYPFVDMQAIAPNTRGVRCSEHREFTGGGSRFQNQDTLMARITPCLENGKIARFLAPDGESIGHGSTEFIVVRGRPSVTDNDYAYYLTISPEVRNFAISQMTGSSGRQRVPTDSLGNINVLLPPLVEQKTIAGILSALDDKIELNRRMNETFEAMARALFQSWFVDATQSGQPKGWHEGKVSDLATLSRDSLNPGEFPDETFDHYSIPAFDEGRTPKPEAGDTIKSNKFIVSPDCVLVSKLNPRIPRVWLPDLRSANRAICSTEFLVTTPKRGVSREFLFCLFTSESFVSVFATMVTGTSGSHQRVKPESLLGMDAVIPPQSLIQSFTETTAPLLKRINHNIAESRTLAALRDALLPKLLSGELRVPVAAQDSKEAD